MFDVFKDIYCPRRKYKRKDTGPEDEKMRVKITLLEYGDKGHGVASGPKSSAAAKGPADPTAVDESRALASANEVVANILLFRRIFLKAFVVQCMPIPKSLHFKSFYVHVAFLSLQFSFSAISIFLWWVLLQIDVDQLLKTLYVANEVK